MRFNISTISIVMSAGIFASPAFAGGITTSIPVSSFDDPAKFWGAAATEFYGPYDRSLKCWVGRISMLEGPARLCMRPHKLVSVNIDETKQHFLAFAGFPLNEQNGHDDCHACSGAMGMVVLEAAGDNFNLIAKDSLATRVGSWGTAPLEEYFELRQIGDNGAYGWVIHSGYTGQGYTYLSASIHGVIGDRIVDLGFIPTGFDDQGNCDDNGNNYLSGQPCSDYQAELLFKDPSIGGFKTIILKHSGTYAGENYNDQVEIPFDPKEGIYKVPEGVLKDG